MRKQYSTVQSKKSIYVRIDFNRSVSDTETKRFIELLADELEFSDLRNGHYNKHGWGMGDSLVIKVKEYKLDRSGANANKLTVTMDDGIVSGSTIFPDDPIKGRFRLYGHITKGLKSVLGRGVEIELDHDEANRIVNDLANMMLRSPNTGITPEIDHDAKDKAFNETL
jgi:hypothetical protein